MSRQFTKNSSPIINQQLHAFADASTKGYGGVMYLRQQSRYLCLCGPGCVQEQSLPTQTADHTKARALCCSTDIQAAQRCDLGISSSHLYAWTDSSIVLGWLSNHTAHWKVFMSHRVSQIIDVLPLSQWRHVPTRDNPANHASRGRTFSIVAYGEMVRNGSSNPLPAGLLL